LSYSRLDLRIGRFENAKKQQDSEMLFSPRSAQMNKLLAASLTALTLLGGAEAFALGECRDSRGLLCEERKPEKPSTGGGSGNGGGTTVTAPEIDATSGAMGIAVLVAGLLLAGEGLRRRRKK
jgi:hypothetical protein